jgi:apolipoprotein N-acyltransferase
MIYFGYTAYCLTWFLGAHPVEITTLPLSISAFFVISAWLTSAAAIAAAVPIGVYVWHKLNLPTTISVVSALWVCIEIGGSILYYITTWGPQSLPLAHYTFNYLGYSQANAPWLPAIAQIGGVFLLTFVTVWFGLFAVSIIRQGAQSAIVSQLLDIKIGTALVFSILAYSVLFSPDTDGRAVLAAGMRIDATSNYHDSALGTLATHQKISQEMTDILNQHPATEIIVLPEDSRFLSGLQKGNLSPPINPMIIDTYRSAQTNNTVQIHAYTYSDGYTDIRSKQILVPGGESMPVLYSFIISIFEQESTTKQLHDAISYTREPIHSDMLTYKGLGMIVCSEIHSPYLTARVARNSQLLIIPSSHASLRGHPLLGKQITHMSQVRAAENNRFLVQSNNHGNTLLVDARGNILESLSDTHAIGWVKLYNTRTIFSIFPYWFPLACLGGIIFLAIKRRLH